MITPAEQLDERFHALRPWTKLASRPAGGWLRAIRTALGMTTGQLASRIAVTQPRINEMEKAEVDGSITLNSLERAAQAMGCRVVYVLVPHEPLRKTMQVRAELLAERRVSAVEQTMRLEDQEVRGQRRASVRRLAEDLLMRPARLWDDE